jgi:hypothetical protein
VCSDGIWLLVWLGFLLGLSELLDQTHRLALETTVESTAGTGVNDIAELFGGEIKESIQDPSVVVPFDNVHVH